MYFNILIAQKCASKLAWVILTQRALKRHKNMYSKNNDSNI